MIPESEVKGTPFQRGEQLGRRFKAQIQDTLFQLSEDEEVRRRQIALLEAMLGYMEEEFSEISEDGVVFSTNHYFSEEMGSEVHPVAIVSEFSEPDLAPLWTIWKW